MKAKQLREMTKQELEQKHRELQKELFSIEFRSPTQELKNGLKIRHLRREIARVLTILKEK